MTEPKVCAQVLFEFVTSDATYKADVVDEAIDMLIGTDPTALVKGIKGLPAEMVELVSDGISDALKAAIKAKLAK